MKIFVTNRFYWILTTLIALFMVGFFVSFIFLIARLVALVFLILFLVEALLLFLNGSLQIKRSCNERFSNGEENDVLIDVKSSYSFPIHIELIDELPEQFQIRDFKISEELSPKANKQFKYHLRPVDRGQYVFGHVNVLAQTAIGLISRQFKGAEPSEVKVYPSFVKLHQYELMAISQNLTMYGQKRVRKVGNSTEFDTIRDYALGDDPRKINWAATARRGHLMTNHFVDEKSQNVYCIIDKSRVMKMPFEQMTLLDYSINAALVIADISLKKGDQVGLVTFENKVGSFLKANHRNTQLYQVMETLYGVETSFKEPDFAALNSRVSRFVNQRSLLLLFTNFESLSSLQRQLPYLKMLNKRHLLLVIYFRNTEVDTLMQTPPANTREIYDQVIAQQLLHEKILIGEELKKAGILSLYTTPQNLNVDVINKYIEVKTRRLL